MIFTYIFFNLKVYFIIIIQCYKNTKLKKYSKNAKNDYIMLLSLFT